MRLSNVKRDEKTNAIISVDNSSLSAYKAARNRENQINSVVNDVENLKKVVDGNSEDLKEIKNLLKALLNGN